MELSTFSREHAESLRSVARSEHTKTRSSHPVVDLDVPQGSTIATVSESGEASLSPTKDQAIKAHLQFMVLCWAMLLTGWNDASAGPMLPRIQSFYGVNFAVVSLIFVFACVGYLAGASLNVYLTEKMKFGKILVLGSVIQMISYALQAPALPFPVFVMSFVINGVGMSLQLAPTNDYVAAMDKNPSSKMGILHASYGAGALSAPLVATQFSQLPRWSFHYLVSLGICTLNTVFLSAIFRFKSKDECRAEIALSAFEMGDTERTSLFRQILGLRNVHIFAAFIFVYVGIEVTIGGWIVTYIIQLRGGGADAGYISSGFFAGIMVGRIILLPLNKWIGERNAVILYGLLSIGLEVVVWQVPSLIGNGVAVSLVGVLFGPMYPIAVNISRTVIPRRIFSGALGWISGLGLVGSAALPFMTGALADRVGISSLHPLLVSMMGLLVVLWAMVPKSRVD